MEIKFCPDDDNFAITVNPGEAMLLLSYLAGQLAFNQRSNITFKTTQFKVLSPLQPILDTIQITELEIPKDLRLALTAASITHISTLVGMSESKLLSTKGIGMPRLKLIETGLAKLGLRLRGTNRFLDTPKKEEPE
jgi:DNA-directed RNA polymerase alpha subunit